MPGNPVPGLPFMRTMQRFEFFALAVADTPRTDGCRHRHLGTDSI